MTIAFEYDGGDGHDIEIQWYHNGVALVDGGGVSGATTTTLTIPDEIEYDGEYYATVTDTNVPGCELTTETVEVEIPDVCRLEITVQPQSQEVTEGGDLELTVAYTGEQGSVTFQWYLDGNPLADGASGGSTISGATTDTLAITNIEAALAGDYTVVVADTGVPECQVTSNPATITVNPSSLCPAAFYYDFEEIATVEGIPVIENLTDGALPFCMEVTTTQPGDIAPGIIGNGAIIGPDHTQVNETDTLVDPSCLDLYDRSWTIRFWRKFVPGDGGGQTDSLNRGLAVDNGTDPDLLLISTVLSFGTTYRYYLEMAADGGGTSINFLSIGTDPAPLNVWHRVIATYDHTTKMLRMKFNNDAYVDFPQAGDFFVVNGPRAIHVDISEGFSMWDELAVLPDVVWDEADATYDWNGGAGRTYPDLP